MAKYAIEFLRVWKQINNPNFKVVESDHFKMQTVMPSFVLNVAMFGIIALQMQVLLEVGNRKLLK